MARYLGYQATHWNNLAKHDSSRRFVERSIIRKLHRTWMSEMSSNQFRVYSFIISRTLGWQKYAEAIPMQVFLHGVREADGSLYKDENGLFVACGTGIKKEDTIRDAIGFLRQVGYITVFPGKRGTVTPTNVYP